MSKTIEIQVEKSRNLIAGLRKHVSEKGEQGINNQQINEMEVALGQLKQMNDEVERLREELTPKVKQMNDMLSAVKTVYSDTKKMLKDCYPQERWPEYGIPDKR